jgi:hypothetical protein
VQRKRLLKESESGPLEIKMILPPANLLKRLFQVEVDLTSNSCEWKLELERSMFARLLFLTF